jgi:IS5 family transposase
VVETDVHFPTDINLLFDALRKMIQLTARLCACHGVSSWRQSEYNVRHLKKLLRIAQSKKRAGAKTEEQKIKRRERIEEAHQEYLDVGKRYFNKVCDTLNKLEKQGIFDKKDLLLKVAIDGFAEHARRQINQIERRVMKGEKIPHHEKVFSIFEPHTEWVSKGKAGVPVELGLKVCVLEDQHQFILYHQVMQKQTDDQIAVEMVKGAKKRYPDLKSVSFDKGFHSPKNQQELSDILDSVALPRKGKLSESARLIESSEEFRQARRKHSAVESAINTLEVHSLDRCLDHGIEGFKRYVALAVVARNLQRIGAILKLQELKKDARKMLRRRLSSNDVFVKKKSFA